MAEIFGVITGAISIGSLAIQNFDSVQQLKAFCDAVKNAPRDVVNTLQELGILAGMLLSLKKDLDQNSVANPKDPVAHQSLEYCVRVSKELELILTDLGRGTARNGLKRKWAMVKIASGGDRIQGHLNRLERAKSMLSLSIEYLSLKLQLELRKSQGIILSCIEENETKESMITEWKSYQNGMAASSIPIGEVWDPIATFRPHMSRRAVESKAHQKNYVYYINRTFLSSLFFFRKGLTMTSVRLHGNWQYTFTPFRIILDADSIWDACASGDIKLLKEYFKDGYTVFDTSYGGFTLLHTAAANARPQLCQWLIEQGAKTDAIAGNLGGTPLFFISKRCSPAYNHNTIRSRNPLITGTRPRAVDIIDSLRVLVENGNCDPMMGACSHISSIHVYNGPIEEYKYLLDYQQTFMIDIEASDDKGIQVIDGNLLYDCSLGFEIARLTLARLKPEEHINRSLEHGANFGHVKSDIPTGFTLLHAALSRLVYFYQIEAPMSECFFLFEDLLKMGFDIHAMTRNGTTPLDYILDYTYEDMNAWVTTGNGVQRIETDDPSKDREARELERDRSDLLLSWMQLLRSRGLSLHSYWKEEEVMHPGCLIGHCDYVRVGINRTFAVEYGDEDEVVVNVRDVVEKTDEVNLPGTWVEEDAYMDENGFVVIHGLNPKADWVIDSSV